MRKPRISPTAASGSPRAVSIMSPAEAETAGGIPSEGICGHVLDIDGEPVFQENPAFVRFMHDRIAEFGLIDGNLGAAASRQGDGYLYIVDLRTPEGPMGNVPTEDIIGAFGVERGRIVPGSYRKMDTHRLMTANGLVQLPPALHVFLVKALQSVSGSGPHSERMPKQ